MGWGGQKDSCTLTPYTHNILVVSVIPPHCNCVANGYCCTRRLIRWLSLVFFFFLISTLLRVVYQYSCVRTKYSEQKKKKVRFCRINFDGKKKATEKKKLKFRLQACVWQLGWRVLRVSYDLMKDMYIHNIPCYPLLSGDQNLTAVELRVCGVHTYLVYIHTHFFGTN